MTSLTWHQKSYGRRPTTSGCVKSSAQGVSDSFKISACGSTGLPYVKTQHWGPTWYVGPHFIIFASFLKLVSSINAIKILRKAFYQVWDVLTQRHWQVLTMRICSWENVAPSEALWTGLHSLHHDTFTQSEAASRNTAPSNKDPCGEFMIVIRFVLVCMKRSKHGKSSRWHIRAVRGQASDLSMGKTSVFS